MWLFSLALFDLQAQVKWIDLSGETALYGQDGALETPLYHRLDFDYLDSNTLVLGFDRYSNCSEDAAHNVYNALLVDVATGTVKLRKTFIALPGRLRLVFSPAGGLMLVSARQIQLLNRNSFEVERSVELPDAIPVTGLDGNNCSHENWRISFTPDGLRIELQTAIWGGTRSPVYSIDGSTLKVVQKRSRPFAEFAADYNGSYVHDHRRSWARLDEDAATNVCDACFSVHVVNKDVIAIDYGGRVDVVHKHSNRIWRTSYRGIADDVTVDRSGNFLAILSASGGGPLWPWLNTYVTVFNVAKDKVVLKQAIHPPATLQSPNTANSVLAVSPSGDAYAVLMGKSVGIFTIKK